MVKVSADQVTREQLGIKEDTLTDSQARKVCEQIANDTKFKAGISNDQLIIQRFIRD